MVLLPLSHLTSIPRLWAMNFMGTMVAPCVMIGGVARSIMVPFMMASLLLMVSIKLVLSFLPMIVLLDGSQAISPPSWSAILLRGTRVVPF